MSCKNESPLLYTVASKAPRCTDDRGVTLSLKLYSL